MIQQQIYPYQLTVEIRINLTLERLFLIVCHTLCCIYTSIHYLHTFMLVIFLIFCNKKIGDPRVSSARIIWVNPDTNTWVRNPCKSSKGELALDVILEKAAVKQSGDAWRIVLDSCLPILHLIDTKRSIPYAIKQIQELLGISCTFDQTIQVIFLRIYF